MSAVRLRGSDSKYGFSDRLGKMVIESVFDGAMSFSEGLAGVQIHINNATKQWGFINGDGRFMIPAIFKSVGRFSEGLAQVQLRNGYWGFVNKRGVLVVPAKYSRTSAFSDGLALVWPEDDLAGHYIDRRGRTALKLSLWSQWSFSDGLTVAGQLGERQYVDKKGFIIAPYEIDPGNPKIGK